MQRRCLLEGSVGIVPLGFQTKQCAHQAGWALKGVGFSRPVMRFVVTDPNLAVTGVGREATGRL